MKRKKSCSKYRREAGKRQKYIYIYPPLQTFIIITHTTTATSCLLSSYTSFQKQPNIFTHHKAAPASLRKTLKQKKMKTSKKKGRKGKKQLLIAQDGWCGQCELRNYETKKKRMKRKCEPGQEEEIKKK